MVFVSMFERFLYNHLIFLFLIFIILISLSNFKLLNLSKLELITKSITYLKFKLCFVFTDIQFGIYRYLAGLVSLSWAHFTWPGGGGGGGGGVEIKANSRGFMEH